MFLKSCLSVNGYDQDASQETRHFHNDICQQNREEASMHFTSLMPCTSVKRMAKITKLIFSVSWSLRNVIFCLCKVIILGLGREYQNFSCVFIFYYLCNIYFWMIYKFLLIVVSYYVYIIGVHAKKNLALDMQDQEFVYYLPRKERKIQNHERSLYSHMAIFINWTLKTLLYIFIFCKTCI